MLKKIITCLGISSLLFTGCGSQENEQTEQNTSDNEWTLVSSTPHPLYHSTIQNPSSGAELSTYLELPNADQNPFKTVVLVPGSTNAGTKNFKNNSVTEQYLADQTAVVYFDADGRGESTGAEDTNGYMQQDGLLAVSLAVAQNPNVDATKMGLASYSFGVAMASGMLARHADEQPFIWYMDWEGPVERKYVTVGCGANADVRKNTDPNAAGLYTSCDDDDFWKEREAVTFLPQITIPYQRIQGEVDHVQKSNEHAIDAINAAKNGESPWTRINSENPNQTFSYENPPDYLPFKKGGQSIQATPDFAKELFELFS